MSYQLTFQDSPPNNPGSFVSDGSSTASANVPYAHQFHPVARVSPSADQARTAAKPSGKMFDDQEQDLLRQRLSNECYGMPPVTPDRYISACSARINFVLLPKKFLDQGGLFIAQSRLSDREEGYGPIDEFGSLCGTSRHNPLWVRPYGVVELLKVKLHFPL